MDTHYNPGTTNGAAAEPSLAEFIASRLSATVKPPPQEEVKAPNPEGTGISQLRSAVRKLRMPKKKPFLIKEEVAELCYRSLIMAGKFYRAEDGRLFYFDNEHHTLRDLCDTDEKRQTFQRYLATVSGLNQQEIEFAYVLTDLKNRAANLPETPVYALAHYDWSTGSFYMSNGGGMMYVRHRGGAWVLAPNGEGALFLTQSRADPFVPDFSKNGEALDWLLDQCSFYDDPFGFSRAEQRILLLTSVLFNLFSKRTHMILTSIGDKGSGKTTALQNWGFVLLGSKFMPTSLLAGRPLDDLIIPLAHESIKLFDNVDSFIKGLEDVLSAYATGTEFERRTFYETTGQTVIKIVTVLLMLSSRNVRFARADVADRSVPLHFLAPQIRVGEQEMMDRVLDRRNAILGDLLTQIGRIADRKDIEVPGMSFRMADFAKFGYRMHAHQDGDGKWIAPEWEAMLQKLGIAQGKFAADNSSVVSVIKEVLSRRFSVKPRLPWRGTTAELLKDCRELAREMLIPFSDDLRSQTFGLLFRESIPAIQQELGVRIDDGGKKGHAAMWYYTITPLKDDGTVKSSKF